jgi:hypothetical protein
MRRIGVPRLPIVMAVVVAGTVWWGAGCAREPTRTTQPTTPTAGVTLEAELHHPGLVVLRSPTFR